MREQLEYIQFAYAWGEAFPVFGWLKLLLVGFYLKSHRVMYKRAMSGLNVYMHEALIKKKEMMLDVFKLRCAKQLRSFMP